MEPIWWNRLASLSNELIRNGTLFMLEGDSLGTRAERKALKDRVSGAILNSREQYQNLVQDINHE